MGRPAPLLFLFFALPFPPSSVPGTDPPGTPAGGGEPGVVSVRFVEPKTPYLSGRERIVVEVDLPPGDSVERLDLFIDGRFTHQARRPPYRFLHDFEALGEPHTILALVFTREGFTGRAEYHSRPVPILSRVDVKLVQLTVTVKDSEGRLVTSLGPGDFTVLENGVEQEVAFFDRGGSPCSIALTLDCSGSMKHRLWRAQKAANDFLKALSPNYEVSVLGFNDSIFLAQDFTRDKRALTYAIQQLEAEGNTALYEAIRAASLHLQKRPNRKAVILFTDGQESFYRQDEAGVEKLEEVLETANLAEVTFFAIGYGGDFARELLSRIADDTGGRHYSAGSRLNLREVYEEISRTLDSQYTLAYYPTPPPPPGEWRPVAVRVRGEGLTARTRKGYYARKP